MSYLERIFSNPDNHTLDVEVLGKCKIESPIRNREFIDDNERILIT